jgi:hypothetical protein
MIAARQIAFGGGGKRKPYDAEIEYLESTGTQYIDTGASPVGADIEISFTFTGLGDNNLGSIFGAMADDNAKDGVFLRSFRSLTVLTGSYGSKGLAIGKYVAGLPTINITEGQKCTLSIKKGESIIINGTLYRNDLAGVELTTLNSVYLFAAHADAGLFRHGVGRVYGYKAIYADKSIDLIPVRKGNIGYMYDRVSGQLFGNQGTGEFVLGPDVNRNEDAFILVSPTQTAIHYSPIVTTDTFSPDEDFRIELRYKYLLNGLGSWGTILGTTGGTNNNGINLRQVNTTNEAYLLVGGINSDFFDCSNWVDLSFSPSEGLVVNGIIFLSPNLIDMSKFTSTNPLYIGEGPRGYGATCASAWKYVRIYRNGVMTRNYIPHVSGSFIDTVSGNILEVNSASTTMVEYYES